MKQITAFFKGLRPKAKYILGILGVAAIVSQGTFAFNKLLATEPRFNSLTGDYEMFRGADVTNGGTVWKDPISGTAGDTFQGLVYYHNGVVDTVAKNTNIKVTIPTKTINKTATLSATISADNAASVSNTVVDGQVIGLSGLTVNLDKDANLALIPGSVKWYPNQLENPNSPQALPNGQNGNEIVGANGVNIGDINGCWEYAGYVTFDFKATPITSVNLEVEKTVRNITAGEKSYADSTTASANDIVEFRIEAEDKGDAIANDLKFKDTLPADLTFVPGSMEIFRDGSTTSEAVSNADANAVFGSGWVVGDLQISDAKKDILAFRMTAPAKIDSKHNVVNTVKISSGAIYATDDATVSLETTPEAKIVKSKTAKNLTTGEIATGSGDSKALNAKPGDTIEYTLITKNSGNATASEYTIDDGINDVLQEANFVSASNGGQVVDSGLTGDDAKLIKYDVVNIAAGETVERIFTVKIMDPLPNNPPDGYNFDHKLYNLYGNAVLVTISIPTPPPVAPILHISKTVRDFTNNVLNFEESDTATAGDTLEYMIAFSNTGNGPADLVSFSDILPEGTSYISGTTVLLVNGGDEHTMPDGIVENGVVIDTIAAGDSGYIKIKAITNASIADGSVLVNKANLTDNGSTISDTAQTTVKAQAVIPPTPTPLPRTGADSVTLASIISAVLTAAGALTLRRFA